MTPKNPKPINDSTKENQINRRQLIRVLGCAAGAGLLQAVLPGSAAARVLPGANPLAQMKKPGRGRYTAIAYNHLSYDVPDYAKARDFYIRVLGMEDTWDNGIQCAVQCGNPPDQIYIRPINPAVEKRMGLQPPRAAWAANMGRGYVDHYGFSIEHFNAREVKEELTRRGLKPRWDGPNAWIFYDPSGFMMHITNVTGVYPGQASPKWKYEAGVKNLASYPKPAGAPFHAYGLNDVVRMVPNVEECRDFYMDLLGMNLLYYRGGSSPVCFFGFGPNNENHLSFRKSPNGLSYVDHFGYAVSNFDQAKAKLTRLGYHPVEHGKYCLSVLDEAGMRVDISGPDLLAHVAADCRRDMRGCLNEG